MPDYPSDDRDRRQRRRAPPSTQQEAAPENPRRRDRRSERSDDHVEGTEPSRRRRDDRGSRVTRPDPRETNDDDFVQGTQGFSGFAFPVPGERLYANQLPIRSRDDRRPNTASTIDSNDDRRPFTPPDDQPLGTYVTGRSPTVRRIDPEHPGARRVPFRPDTDAGPPDLVGSISPDRPRRALDPNDPRFPPRSETARTDRRRPANPASSNPDPRPSASTSRQDNTSLYIGSLNPADQAEYHSTRDSARRSQLREWGKSIYNSRR